MHSGKVYHACHEGVHVLRYTGDIRYTLGPSLEDFIEQLFSRHSPRGFVIDLCAADSIDSTNLGLLAGIANQMRRKQDARVAIVSDRADINELLASMGFDDVFDIVNSGTAVLAEDEEIPLAAPQAAALSRTVLKAHRTLMALNETNRELFRDVVALMEQKEAGENPDTGC